MSSKQITGDDPRSMVAQIAERIEGHAPGYDLVIYARPHQWRGLISEIERLRLTLATVAVFIEGEQIAHAVVVPEGASAHDKNLLSLIETVNAALERDCQQVVPEPCKFPDCTNGDTSQEAYKACKRCTVKTHSQQSQPVASVTNAKTE